MSRRRAARHRAARWNTMSAMRLRTGSHTLRQRDWSMADRSPKSAATSSRREDKLCSHRHPTVVRVHWTAHRTLRCTASATSHPPASSRYRTPSGFARVARRTQPACVCVPRRWLLRHPRFVLGSHNQPTLAFHLSTRFVYFAFRMVTICCRSTSCA